MDLVRVRAYLEAREGKRFQAREDRHLRALAMTRSALLRILPAFPRVRRAFLFGSVTRPGAMRPDSDIDIAVEGILTAEEYFLWRDLIERFQVGKWRLSNWTRLALPSECGKREKWSMKPQIQTLKADITADIRAIEEIFLSLDRYPDSPSNEEQLIVIAYYLHNLYSAFESVFQHIAEAFENQVDDRSGWHVELLRRMTLDIEGIRPRLLGPETFDSSFASENPDRAWGSGAKPLTGGMGGDPPKPHHPLAPGPAGG